MSSRKITPLTNAKRTGKRNARGYTVVEVLAAMTLFAIGAAGVIGMERVTIQGGADARRFDVAANIANEWAFRLQRDAMFWTLPNANDPTTSNLTTRTTWLADIDSNANVWVSPAIPSSPKHGGMSPAFDIYGRDLASGSDDHMFCVQYRLNWIANPGTAPALKPGALIRAEVRVFWARLDNAAIGDCAAPNPMPDTTAGQTTYHFVYATTAIRQNPDQ